ncbi:MarR family transcriptional regulator [Burkholderia ubonensis]|nr:MarR family transcriptional regulator [Burkholderia ubonensis]
MPSSKSVQDARMSESIREIHMALISIVSVVNRPDVDERMIQEAGISLDRALFPLLTLIERLGPIGIVDLGGRVGRDHSTVSRQVAKLESLGLVKRRVSVEDGRVRTAVVTFKGKAMTDAVDAARNRLGRALFAQWAQDDVDEFVWLLKRFSEDLKAQASDTRT